MLALTALARLVSRPPVSLNTESMTSNESMYGLISEHELLAAEPTLESDTLLEYDAVLGVLHSLLVTGCKGETGADDIMFRFIGCSGCLWVLGKGYLAGNSSCFLTPHNIVAIPPSSLAFTSGERFSIEIRNCTNSLTH